ncbi:MAG: hypothetical protein JJLCMIEE_02029 [Acidimicrobiales bacterium]|nr:MAG: alpha-L-fucosidase [Actinomycetota bacterium]MBV6508962.1 hypothetical protein [Acidimicrobiales bacterium]RIK08402.1 MAG: alpha-L-fucosidase [Acidobacteriota bacterium]
MPPDPTPLPYQPNFDSLRLHPLPRWYDDAKLGVFLHWGLSSVPGWAPRVPDIQTMFHDHGPSYVFRNNPYAEWYMNTMQIEDSPTRHHHDKIYGAEFAYDGFIPTFNRQSRQADLDALADLCRRTGARYVVLTSKHHEGFCLWPTDVMHPAKGSYHSERDLVGDLTLAVRQAGMRMGLYYSGGYDWPYNGAVIRTGADAILAVPHDRRYADYIEGHFRELIERYEPSILWNDIAFPATGDLAGLLAHYYNSVPDGVVNDRWLNTRIPGGSGSAVIVRGLVGSVERLWRFLPSRFRRIAPPRVPHCDFTTPEYEDRAAVAEKKWESVRGVGHSFGANRHESPDDILSETELVRMFVDIVSKNGNLLIGIGPRADGTIPESQQSPLLGLGRWLEDNGDAIFGSRPWRAPQSVTTEGQPVRFTSKGDTLFATFLEAPSSRAVRIQGLEANSVPKAHLLGTGQIRASVEGRDLLLHLPDSLPLSPAHVVAIKPAPRWRRPGSPNPGAHPGLAATR